MDTEDETPDWVNLSALDTDTVFGLTFGSGVVFGGLLARDPSVVFAGMGAVLFAFVQYTRGKPR